MNTWHMVGGALLLALILAALERAALEQAAPAQRVPPVTTPQAGSTAADVYAGRYAAFMKRWPNASGGQAEDFARSGYPLSLTVKGDGTMYS